MARLIEDLLELADILRPAWGEISESIPAWHPRCEGDDDDDASTDADNDADSTADDADDSDSDSDDDADDKPAAKTEPNWKQMARKHEREAKKRQKELDTLKDKLAAREDADRSEHEKAIEEAKQQAVKDLEAKHEKERRQDRLEVASTKLAARGFTLGEGDKAKTLKFADPDDALVYLERDIERGALDIEDLFDARGKVDEDQLAEALTDLLERKPHLASEGKPKKVKGSADAGKGDAPKSGESSVEEQLKKIRRPRIDQGQAMVVTRRQ